MRVELQTALGEYLDLPPASIDSGFRFSGERFQGSVGMYRFMAFAKRRLARDVPVLPYGCSLEEAVALLAGESAGSGKKPGDAPSTADIASASTAAPTPLNADPGNTEATRSRMPVLAVPAAVSGAHIGIDIEAVDSMPETADYRSHDFYRDVFTPAEIAYCLLRPEPRRHFCGLFCAKEAFIKAAPERALRPGDIEIGHEASGRPFYRQAGTLPVTHFDLSISHAGAFAIAATIGFPGAQPGSAGGLKAEAETAPAWPGGKPAALAAPAAQTDQRIMDSLLRAGLLLSLGLSLYLLLRR